MGIHPLHFAAGYNGNPDVTRELLNAGAEINVRDKYGESTPLHVAASWNSNPAVFMTLLAAGADVNVHRAGTQTATPLQVGGI